MKVSDLFESLSYGELSNISPAQSINRNPNIEPGDIGVENYGKIIVATNDALREMYSTYILARDSVSLNTDPLERKYVIVAPDLVQILYVDVPEHIPYNYIYGNSQYAHHKMRILNKNTIIFDYDMTAIVPMTVEYQVLHPRLQNSEGILEQDVNIPPFLEEPMRALIASKIYSNMSTEVAMAKSAEKQNKYATQMAILEARGLLDTSVDMNRRDFRESGLV